MRGEAPIGAFRGYAPPPDSELLKKNAGDGAADHDAATPAPREVPRVPPTEGGHVGARGRAGGGAAAPPGASGGRGHF